MTFGTGPPDRGADAVPYLDPTGDLTTDLLRCGLCSRTLRPAGDGLGRRYVCRPSCPQPGVPAARVEQDLLLRALVRAHTALYQVGRNPSALAAPPASHAEVRRWQWCDPRDRAGMLRTAFAYVVVDWRGQIHPVWRHYGDPQDPTGIGGDRDTSAGRVA